MSWRALAGSAASWTAADALNSIPGILLASSVGSGTPSANLNRIPPTRYLSPPANPPSEATGRSSLPSGSTPRSEMMSLAYFSTAAV